VRRSQSSPGKATSNGGRQGSDQGTAGICRASPPLRRGTNCTTLVCEADRPGSEVVEVDALTGGASVGVNCCDTSDGTALFSSGLSAVRALRAVSTQDRR